MFATTEAVMLWAMQLRTECNIVMEQCKRDTSFSKFKSAELVK